MKNISTTLTLPKDEYGYNWSGYESSFIFNDDNTEHPLLGLLYNHGQWYCFDDHKQYAIEKCSHVNSTKEELAERIASVANTIDNKTEKNELNAIADQILQSVMTYAGEKKAYVVACDYSILDDTMKLICPNCNMILKNRIKKDDVNSFITMKLIIHCPKCGSKLIIKDKDEDEDDQAS